MTAVCCGDCANFIRSIINPAQGMGRCRVDAKTQPANYRGYAPSLWPFSERLCAAFQPCN